MVDVAFELVEELAEYVNTSAASDGDYLQSCIDGAVELVTKSIGDVDVPDSIKRRATLECASELFHRRNAPSGVQQQFLGMENVGGTRLARDPMTGARELLRPYLPLAFA